MPKSWPILSVAEFDLADMICYVIDLDFFKLKVRLIRMWPNLSMAELDLADMLFIWLKGAFSS